MTGQIKISKVTVEKGITSDGYEFVANIINNVTEKNILTTIWNVLIEIKVLRDK